MSQFTDIAIQGEVEDGVLVNITEEQTTEVMGDEETKEKQKQIVISYEDLEELIKDGKEILNQPTIRRGDKTKITTVHRGDEYITELYIEAYEFPNSVSVSETWGILTDSYELGTVTTDNITFKTDITHSTQSVDGTAFRLCGNGFVEIKYVCRLTEWVYDEEGEIEDIVVPETPYDSGQFNLEPGDYRVWEETKRQTRNS